MAYWTGVQFSSTPPNSKLLPVFTGFFIDLLFLILHFENFICQIYGQTKINLLYYLRVKKLLLAFYVIKKPSRP